MPAGDEPDATLARSMEELERKTRGHQEAWGLGATERWDVDLDTGLISFSGDGQIATAPVQVIGTYDSLDGSWMWGWDHPSVDAPLAHHARLVRDFGDRYGLARYTRPTIACTEDEAWTFTALACHLANASGAYRGPSGTTFVFMTFGEVTVGRLT